MKKKKKNSTPVTPERSRDESVKSNALSSSRLPSLKLLDVVRSAGNHVDEANNDIKLAEGAA